MGEGLGQLDAYLERLGLDHGVLVVFDERARAAPVGERCRVEPASAPSGRPVTLVRA